MIKKIDIAGLQLDNYTVREMLMRVDRQHWFAPEEYICHSGVTERGNYRVFLGSSNRG